MEEVLAPVPQFVNAKFVQMFLQYRTKRWIRGLYLEVMGIVNQLITAGHHLVAGGSKSVIEWT